MYRIVLNFYRKGIYSAEDVYKFVLSGQLTQEEYNAIVSLTGDPAIDEILLDDDSGSF